jgi:hypothetical protein
MKTSICIILILFANFASGQKTSAFKYTKVYFKNEWKFIGEDGNFLLDKELANNTIENLCIPNGLVITSDGNKYGFMALSGKQIIANMYDLVSCFQFGLAAVKINQKWGLIDTNNKFIIEPIYDLIGSISSDSVIPVINNGKLGLFDINGKVISDFKHSWFPYYNENIIPPIFSNGLLPVFKPDSSFNILNWKLGYINTQGILKINAEFGWRGTLPYFINERANVTKNDVPIIIDTSGNEIISSIRNGLYFSEDGYSVFTIENGKQGIIDKNGQIILEPKYMNIKPFSEDLAALEIEQNGEGGVISAFVNKKGEFVFDKKFGFIHSFNEGLAAVEINGKWTYIDKSGNFIVKPQFDAADYFSEGLGMIGIKKGKRIKFGFINKEGKVIIEPIFDEVNEFRLGLAPVKVGNKFGYINNKGEMVIKPKFQNAHSFIEEIITD